MKKQNSGLNLWYFIGRRFIRLKNKNGNSNIIFLTLLLGITGGLAVLIVVLGIMNGFQNNHISRRLEIGSYHAVIYHNKGMDIERLQKIKDNLYNKFNSIQAVIPYIDKEVIALFTRGFYSEKHPVKLRAIDVNEVIKDEKFNKYFKITDGTFLQNNDNILIGQEMAWQLISNKRTDESVYITPDISLRSIKSKGIKYGIDGYYKTGSYDYDRYWSFMSLEGYERLHPGFKIETIGIKFDDYHKHKNIIKDIKLYLGDEFTIKSGEEINKGYFAALKLEKVMIIFLFTIIFLLVSINIFGAIKLTIIEKQENILILKAIGTTPFDIQMIFMMESIILAFAGSIFGVISGVFISLNVSNIFYVFEIIVNSIIFYINMIIEPVLVNLSKHILPSTYSDIALFKISDIVIYDTSVYYQTTFLVKHNLSEIIMITLTVVAITILSAYIPISSASIKKPNELLNTGGGI